MDTGLAKTLDVKDGGRTPSHPPVTIEHMFDRDTSDGETGCPCRIVAEKAALSYTIHGHEAVVADVPWMGSDTHECSGRFVVVPSLHRIDFVADDAADLRTASPRLQEQVEAGWEVWAVVPLARLAEAHLAYRDRVDFVQGWWTGNAGQVAFTEPEVP